MKLNKNLLRTQKQALCHPQCGRTDFLKTYAKKSMIQIFSTFRVEIQHFSIVCMYFIEQNRDTLEDGNQIIHDLIGTIGTTD